MTLNALFVLLSRHTSAVLIHVSTSTSASLAMAALRAVYPTAQALLSAQFDDAGNVCRGTYSCEGDRCACSVKNILAGAEMTHRTATAGEILTEGTHSPSEEKDVMTAIPYCAFFVS